MHPFLIRLTAIFIYIVVLTAKNTSAQIQKFVQIANENQVIDNSEVRDFKIRISKNPNVARYFFVTLNPLASSQKDGSLILEIPDKEKAIVAQASHVTYYSDTEYEWIGKTDEGRGTVIILSKEGRIAAHISTPDGVYEIFPVFGELYCLQEIDTSEGNDIGCVTTSNNADSKREGLKSVADSVIHKNAKMYACQPVVNPRVLILYTSKAMALAGSIANMQTLANMSISQFNSCIYNSGITSNAALVLAGVEFLNFAETSTITTDLNNLEINATAKNLRDQYQADMVVLFTDAEYQGGSTRGKSQTVSLENSKSYAIVELWHATASKTFAHEVGHLYGCRHEDDNSQPPSYAKGHNIKNLEITVDRTVMVGNNITENEAINRLMNFSNPNVSVGGRATGTSDENNALRISQSHAVVSAFRPNPSTVFTAYLDGPTYVNAASGKNYELNYSCGTGPYTFSWQYSYDGVNYTSSNITTEVFTWYFYQNQKIYIKGIVTGSGKSATAFITVTAQMPSPYKKGTNAEIDSVSQKNSNLKVTPNPASDEVNISYNLQADSDVKLEVIDQSGTLVKLLKKENTRQIKGLHAVNWNCKNVPAGTYLARISYGDIVEISRVIIIK
ncbi:T9SS type A sorting domain-containing protein [Dyadobacter flavalbus]|uniref:T9SS type A sorting domain-containing protein n=1 Tax=Dyadobacter flavalbus TaxID=2579942 RepID=A0A5M8QV35_9BACT|nr:M12 family metallo-peptidase [Dyadobacter flavalbus]KAA6440117.1 T9SS type A sorting domain-containing protein [Dyadobacter flavalbus]